MFDGDDASPPRPDIGPQVFSAGKAESHCAVCGARGHWKGDPKCPQSSDQTGQKFDKSLSLLPMMVLTVAHHDGAKKSVNFEEPSKYVPENTYRAPTSPIYMVTSPISEGNLAYGRGHGVPDVML